MTIAAANRVLENINTREPYGGTALYKVAARAIEILNYEDMILIIHIDFDEDKLLLFYNKN